MTSLPIIFLFLVLLFADTANTFGQHYPDHIVDSKATGEEASAAIDNFLVRAVDSRERIFVIASLGRKEKNDALNLNRLCDAREYLLGRSLGERSKEYFDMYPTVFAEGPTVEGEARIDFYLGSRLFLTRLIRSNQPANLNCCEEFTLAEIVRKRKECNGWKAGVLQNTKLPGKSLTLPNGTVQPPTRPNAKIPPMKAVMYSVIKDPKVGDGPTRLVGRYPTREEADRVAAAEAQKEENSHYNIRVQREEVPEE
jgi:hypothetical protein